MFVGHYGPAFALKRAAPETPMVTLAIAVQLVDIAWAVLVLAGVEQVRIVPGFTESNALDLHHIPYTHGLVASIGWALAGGAAAFALHRSRRGFIAVALAIASHWILDLLMHRPDLPILDDDLKVGLGLWNYRWPAFAAEILALGGGLILYARGSTPVDRIGRLGPVVLFAALAFTQLFNLLIDPARTPMATAGAGLASFLCIPIGIAIVDKHRVFPKNPPR